MGLTAYALRVARTVAGPAGWPPPTAIAPPPLTGTLGLRREDMGLSLPGGETTATLWMPTDPQAVIILIHGGAVTRDTTWPWAAALARHGLASLAPDLDGHGSNSRPYTTIGTAGDVLLAAGDALAARRMGTRVGVLAASLGGVIALRAAAMATPPPAAVALLAAPHRSTFGQLLTPNTLRALWDGQALPGVPVRRATPRGRGSLFTDTLAGEGVLGAAHALADRPLLLVHGQYDPYAPPSQGAALARAHGSAVLWSIAACHAGAMYDPATLDRVAIWLADSLLADCLPTGGML